MKEQKNLFLAYILIFILLFAYQYYYVKTHPQKVMKGIKTQSDTARPVKTIKTPKRIQKIVPVTKKEITKAKSQNKLIKIETSLFRLSFSPIGGIIKKVEIKPYNVIITPLYSGFYGTFLIKGNEEYNLNNIPFSDTIYKKNNETYLVFSFKNDTISFQKVFVFNDTTYNFKIFANGGDKVEFLIPAFKTNEKIRDARRYASAIFYMDNKPITIGYKKMKGKSNESFTGAVGWGGYKSKYFISAVLPEKYGEEVNIQKIGEHPYFILKTDKDMKLNGFIGPLDYKILQSSKKGFENAIYFGMSLIRPISKFIYYFIVFLHRFISNYGWVIVIFTIAMVVVLSPLSMISYHSMQKMKEIQPKIDVIRKKYAKDAPRMNKEIMELYRKSGVNPFSGCLPMFIQFPVFFALYAVLNSTIQLKGAPFIWWIKDLSVRDPYFILPVLMGISMYIQQRYFSPQSVGQEQKMMSYLMPILMVYIFAFLPSGLVLYWFIYNVLMIGQQYYIQKKAKGG